MARSFTATLIQTAAQQRADMVNSTFIGTTEWLTYVSASYAFLYDLLVKAGENYFESTQTLTAASTALPSDYYGTKTVYYVPSTNQYVPLRRVEDNEFHLYYDGGGSSYPTGYRVAGANIVLLPAGTTVGTCIHYYVPAPADITSGSTTIDGVSGWEEFIVLDCAIKARIKAESSVEELVRERALILQRIEDMAENRSLQTARRIVDVTSYEDDGW